MLAEVASIPETKTLDSDPIPEAHVSLNWTLDSLSRAKLEYLASEIEELTILYNAGLALASTLDLEEIVWAIYEGSGRLVNTSNFALAIYDERTDMLAFHLVFDRGERVKPFSVKLPNHREATGRVLATQSPLLIGDLLEAGYALEPIPGCPDQAIRSWLGVPIRHPMLADKWPLGVIVVWSNKPRAFAGHDLWLLSALGAQAALAIHNARLFQAGQQRVTELTGLNTAIVAENARLHGCVLTERYRVVEAREQARKELAQDLHDGPTQLISAIMMQLSFCQKALEKDPSLLSEQIVYMQELAERAIHQMRTMLFELRPLVLETQGLEAALQILVERRQQEAGATRLALKVETCWPDDALSRQQADVESALFAIVQEAVNNALKHAEAKNVVVHLKESPDAIYTIITDDGKGFDTDKVLHGYEHQGSLGMANLRDLAGLIGGQLTVQSESGRGTCITVCVPV